MTTPQYSRYPLEQAAFEQVLVSADLVKEALQAAGPNAVALGCIQSAAWVLDGHLVFSEDFSNVNELREDIADNVMGLAHFEGIGVQELESVRDNLNSWLANPEIDHAPEGAYMGERLGLDLNQLADNRHGQFAHGPKRQRVRDDERVPVVFRDVNSGTEVGEYIQIGQGSPEEVSEEQKALLGGAEYVQHIVLELPKLNQYPAPSLMSDLDEGDRLIHLCYGQPFTPTLEPSATSFEVSESGEFALEFRFQVSRAVAEALRSAGQ